MQTRCIPNFRHTCSPQNAVSCGVCGVVWHVTFQGNDASAQLRVSLAFSSTEHLIPDRVFVTASLVLVLSSSSSSPWLSGSLARPLALGPSPAKWMMIKLVFGDSMHDVWPGGWT